MYSCTFIETNVNPTISSVCSSFSVLEALMLSYQGLTYCRTDRHSGSEKQLSCLKMVDLSKIVRELVVSKIISQE